MPSFDEPRGREYLQKVRPEAIGHLLAFFKEAGKHLDPRTRFLISVVTKVINFSPRGLRQYIKRSMENGATKDEIIDAILLAYPCAGLTKVDDAIAVMLDMNIPDAAGGGDGWQAIAGAEKLAEGQSGRFESGGRRLFVARYQGRLHALDDTCPHRGGSLSEGTFANGVATCPLHSWEFRVADGSSAGEGRCGAACFEIRESAGKAEVRIPRA